MNQLKNMTTSKSKKTSLTKDFNHFVNFHTDLSEEKAHYVKELFQHDHIRKTLKISLVIIIWSLINSFFDMTLIGWGLVETAVTEFSILNFVPWLLLVTGTFIGKYFFINKIDVDGYFSMKQKIYGALPAVGVLFFISSVFSQERVMLTTTRNYLRYVKKRGITFIIGLLNKKLI